VFFKNSGETAKNNPIDEQQAAVTQEAVARQHIPDSPTNECAANFKNLQIGNKPASANQSPVNENDIRQGVATLERQVNFSKQKIQEYPKASAKQDQHPVGAYNKLCEYKIKHDKLLQEPHSLEKSVTNPDSVSVHEANNDVDESLSHQQNHQGASKEKEGPVLGKFGNVISRILPEKLINKHMPESFNIRYLNTTISNKINALAEMRTELISYSQTTKRKLEAMSQMLALHSQTVQSNMQANVDRVLSETQKDINERLLKCSRLIPEVRPQEYTTIHDIENQLNELIKIIGNKIEELQIQIIHSK